MNFDYTYGNQFYNYYDDIGIKSVKYKIALFDNDSIQDINERCCCNRCACIFIDDLSELPGGVTK